MRGEKKFKEVAIGDTTTRPKRKGRNSHHIHRRNECLMDRYYYYSNFTDKRYELIVEELSTEFFLSVHTIPDLIQDHMEQLLELKEKKPAITYFSNRWPHIKW